MAVQPDQTPGVGLFDPDGTPFLSLDADAVPNKPAPRTETSKPQPGDGDVVSPSKLDPVARPKANDATGSDSTGSPIKELPVNEGEQRLSRAGRITARGEARAWPTEH